MTLSATPSWIRSWFRSRKRVLGSSVTLVESNALFQICCQNWKISKDKMFFYTLAQNSRSLQYVHRNFRGIFLSSSEIYSGGERNISGECSRHLETIKRTPQRVREAKAPRTLAKFYFLKILETESIFQNSNIFLAKTSIFFNENLRKIE